ncbi:hypothetical protein LCGC14_1884620 [marine sediment metagenome]|uniref:Uncharacterized protein n=1 Tax=marine sediment metagenome TaxID=412755 RepID=A0A0F9GPN5_9ZZZZ
MEERTLTGQTSAIGPAQNKAPHFWTKGIKFEDNTWHNFSANTDEDLKYLDDTYKVGDTVSILEAKKGNYWNATTIEAIPAANVEAKAETEMEKAQYAQYGPAPEQTREEQIEKQLMVVMTTSKRITDTIYGNDKKYEPFIGTINNCIVIQICKMLRIG